MKVELELVILLYSSAFAFHSDSTSCLDAWFVSLLYLVICILLMND